MNIEITQSVDHYRADCKNLPGTPPVGLGDTPEMAVAALFWHILFEPIGGSRPDERWTKYIKKDEPIVVNGKTWAWPESYKRG